MKILVLGGTGMAGHMLVKYFKKIYPDSVFFTTREQASKGGLYLDVRDTQMLDTLIRSIMPDVVINAVGILNQHAEARELEAYHVNALLPNIVKDIVNSIQAKFIHISTDCVFLGDRGGYTEKDTPDGTSIYAKTKALGEVTESPHLTIRTSIVGPEIREHGIGLLHWFLQQRGTVGGYVHVFWNGVTTLELAKAIHHLLLSSATGLYHLHSPQPISKYELLQLFQQAFGNEQVTITPDDQPRLDRTLSSVRRDIQYTPPSYEQMLDELKKWM